VRQPELPETFYLLPARQTVFDPARNSLHNAGHDRAFLALPELRGEYDYRSPSGRQSIVGFSPPSGKYCSLSFEVRQLS
jgi:hypothetical protein